ncbi:alpha/beta fold hydrolase [Nocardioides marmorisolisilvae]|uniref:Alpha/beta fold hydrolase n=2 Tax=Nocardioides marmorisolisilvae TaxID=1542737 RepID=A0A3N0DXP3_9ACTN|nr:alpha/beta fold hydrolase [Nocardioides marmorisolisilvae]
MRRLAVLEHTDQVVRHAQIGGRDVAYSVVGDGPPLVIGGWWCSHLVLNWQDPAFRDYISRLARHHTVIRYDQPGRGASEPDNDPPSDLKHETALLLGLFDELGLARADLLGASSGSGVAAAFAAAHPSRVSHLVLYGAFAHGEEIAPASARQAMLDAVAGHWGLGSRLLADVFVPGASNAERDQFAAFQRQSARSDQAHDALEATYRLDAREALAKIKVPTTVLHRRDDRAVPFALGVDVAKRVPHASFVALEGEDHFPWLGDSDGVADATLRGLGHHVPTRVPAPGPQALTDREREILELVAEGLTDTQIGERLVLSPHTVHRHVANARVKLGVRSRAAAAAAVRGV